MRNSPQHKQQQQHLKNSFLDAIAFLKKTKLKKSADRANLFQSPWHLFIGTEKSGKSTLLANAEIPYNLSRKKSHIAQHTDPNWWVNKSGILLDIPANYFDEKKTLLKTLLTLIRKKSAEKKIDSLNVVININELLGKDDSELQALANQLIRKTKQVTRAFTQQLPIHLIINQCDHIPGFNDFFYHSTKEERQQIFGVTLNKQTAYKQINQLSKEFDRLTQRIDKQLVWQLYHEKENIKRALIKGFPNELKQFKKQLMPFAENLLTHCHTIKGIYFTSATQINPINRKDQESIAKEVLAGSQHHDKAYFIHNLVANVIIPTRTHEKPSRLKPLFYLCLISIIIGMIAIFASNFIDNTQHIEKVEVALEKYNLLQEQPNHSLSKNITLLTQLADTTKIFNNNSLWQKFMPNAEQNTALQAKLKALYQQTAKNLLIPMALQSLNLVLKNNSKASPELLYRSLKTYLMLTQPARMNKPYIINTMRFLWQGFNNEPELIRSLNKMLGQLQPVSLDKQLLKNTQAALSILPKSALGYLIFTANLPPQKILTLNLKNDPAADKILTLKNPHFGLSALYTLATLKTLTQANFQQAANVALNGSWVIGKNVTPSDLSAEQLSKQLKHIYLLNYANNWLNFIGNIQLKSQRSVPQLQLALSLLDDAHSPLNQLLSLAESNLTHQILQTNKALNTLVSTFNSTNPAFQQLTHQLANYLNSARTPQQIFSLSKQRILNQGKGDAITAMLHAAQALPKPISYWYYQLAQNSWQLMMKATSNFINLAWSNTVYTPYKNQIANRYPFNTTASQFVRLNSFINLFAPNAVISQFYKQYLQGFINTDQLPWHPIALNNTTLNISKLALDAFTKTQALQSLFFPEGDQQLFIPFTLQADRFSTNLSQVNIRLGKQATTFTVGNDKIAAGFNWPDSTNKVRLTINFIEKAGQRRQLKFTGPWAMWKFIQQSHLKPIKNKPGQWQGMIEDGTDALQFIITTKQKENPFSLARFENTKLPSTTLLRKAYSGPHI